MYQSTTRSEAERGTGRHTLRVSALLASLVDEKLRAAEHPPGDRDDDDLAAFPEPVDDAAGGRPPGVLTLGEIIDRTAHAGFGFFLGFLTLVSVPFVGLSTPFGLALAVGAVQMIVGLQRPWLPARLRRVRVSPRVLRWLRGRLVRWTAGLEHLVRPRFEFLTRGAFWTLCGVCILSQALILSLPLAIPGTNVPFMATILLYAIALLESDGLLVMVCHTIIVVQVVLAAVFWEIISGAVGQALAWLTA